MVAPSCSRPEDVQVDGPRADGAAAGQGDPGAAGARHQRAQHQARSAHGLDQFVGRFGAQDALRPETNGLALHVHGGSDIHQQALHGADVAHAGHAMQGDGFIGQQRRRQRGQRRVLRAVGRNLAAKRGSARNYEFIHGTLSLFAQSPAGHVRAMRPDAAPPLPARCRPCPSRWRSARSFHFPPASSTARSGETPAACAMMRRARSTSFSFFGWTFTIRLP